MACGALDRCFRRRREGMADVALDGVLVLHQGTALQAPEKCGFL
jgi:hypothetical protein